MHHSRLSTRSSYQLYSFSGDRRFCYDNHRSFVYDSPNLFCGPSGLARTGLTAVWSEPGHRTHLTSLISTRRQQLVRRKAFSHVHACDDQRFDAEPDAVLVLALPTNESETSQSQKANSKKAIRMLLYSKRSYALPTLKNALRLQKQRKTCEMIPLARTTVSTWVAPAR